MSELGPITEQRFAQAFAAGAVISRKEAADLIGLDAKTLDALSNQGVIRAVRKGAHRAYTERDLRRYLLEGPDIECAEPKPRPSPARSGKVIPFSQRRGKRGR